MIIISPRRDSMSEKTTTTKGFRLTHEEKDDLNKLIAKSPLNDADWLHDVIAKAALYEKATKNEFMQPKITEMAGLMRRITMLFDNVMEQSLDDLAQHEIQITKAVQSKEEEIESLNNKINKQNVSLNQYKEEALASSQKLKNLEEELQEVKENNKLQRELAEEYKTRINRLENEIATLENKQIKYESLESDFIQLRDQYQSYKDEAITTIQNLKIELSEKNHELYNQEAKVERIQDSLHHQEQSFLQKINILELEQQKTITELSNQYKEDLDTKIILAEKQLRINILLDIAENSENFEDLKELLPFITKQTVEELMNAVPENKHDLLKKLFK